MKLAHSIRVAFEECYILEGAFAGEGSQACFATSNERLKIYDVRTGAHMLEVGGHTAPITDLVSSATDPAILYSSQQDTGVMVTDLRVGKGIHFLTELTHSGQESYSMSADPTGTKIALAVNGDIHIIDQRTWCTVREIHSVHMDEITRVRFCAENWICTGGEDCMINVLDVTLKENDMMLDIINANEVVGKMRWFPEHNCVTSTGTCENAYVVPLVQGMHETKINRRDFDTYVVDFVTVDGLLAAVLGTRNEDHVGPLELVCATPGEHYGRPLGILSNGHREIARVAMSYGNVIVTGGEDGTACIWNTTSAPAGPLGLNIPAEEQAQAHSQSRDSASDASMKAERGSQRKNEVIRQAGKPFLTQK